MTTLNDPTPFRCVQCHIEGRKLRLERFLLIYDGMGLCGEHFDKKRARLLDTPIEVTDD